MTQKRFTGCYPSNQSLDPSHDISSKSQAPKFSGSSNNFHIMRSSFAWQITFGNINESSDTGTIASPINSHGQIIFTHHNVALVTVFHNMFVNPCNEYYFHICTLIAAQCTYSYPPPDNTIAEACVVYRRLCGCMATALLKSRHT